MTDHLAAARAAIHAEHGWSMAAPASSLADMAYAISRILDHLEAQQPEPEPEPDYGPRPAGCCGTCPPILGGGYDCTCADNPRCDANKADRIDRDGERWVWCDGCDGFRLGIHHGMHESGYGRSVFWIDEHYGPLTFASRPAEPPTAAPQPDEAHGDAPDPARPAETHTDNIRAEAWDEGWRTGYADGAHYDDPRITPNPYRKDRA